MHNVTPSTCLPTWIKHGRRPCTMSPLQPVYWLGLSMAKGHAQRHPPPPRLRRGQAEPGYSWFQKCSPSFVVYLCLRVGTRDFPCQDIAHYLMSKVWSEREHSAHKLSSSIDYQLILISCVQKSVEYKGSKQLNVLVRATLCTFLFLVPFGLLICFISVVHIHVSSLGTSHSHRQFQDFLDVYSTSKMAMIILNFIFWFCHQQNPLVSDFIVSKMWIVRFCWW